MANVLIVVEGKTDVVFLAQYLEKLGLVQYGASSYTTEVVLPTTEGQVKIISTAGRDRIKGRENIVKPHVVNTIKEELVKGKVLVIYDADEEFEASREYFLEQWRSLDLSDNPEIFLFPNNQDPGEIEDLLIQCIHSCNIPLLDYWQGFKKGMAPVFRQLDLNYKECRICSGRKSPKEPDLKDMIYSICDQLKVGRGENHSQDYLDTAIWDLDSPALEPLRDFLMKNI